MDQKTTTKARTVPQDIKDRAMPGLCFIASIRVLIT